MNVNVVMGGPSAENEVSLLSGVEVLKHLAKSSKYRVRAVVISKEKEFFSHRLLGGKVPPFEAFVDPSRSPSFQGPFSPYSCDRLWSTCDVAFLALHGSFGEDGQFQGYLDTLGIPYTGSGVFASSLAMNKIATKLVYLQNGLDTPAFSLIGDAHPRTTVDGLVQKHGLPCFVKCPQSGSSRLMGRAQTRQELESLITELSREADELLVETMVSGVEFSCPVLESPSGTAYALPPVEIRPLHSTFFDYAAKYTANGSEEIVPAPRPPEVLQRVQEAALRAHRVLGCRGVSRTDMVLADDRVQLLETNTLPGLTATSLLPKCYAAHGGSYEKLMDVLIERACALGITSAR